MRCDNCKFWELTHEFRKGEKWRDINHPDDYIGLCHRYPPQIDSVYAGKCEDATDEGAETLDTCWRQPLTTGHEWCGEFIEAKKQDKP